MAAAVIMTGVLMAVVGTTIVVLALPEIQRGLHVALSAVVWVIISFLLLITLLATKVGRLGEPSLGWSIVTASRITFS